MSKQSLTSQPNKAPGQPGQTPTIIWDNKPYEVVALVGIRLGAQDLSIVSQPQAPPQPTTINVQNVQITNYNCAPPEAPKQGHSGSSRDAHLQPPQTTASASRGDEDRPHDVKNKPSAPNTRQNPQEKTQSGSQDKVNSTRASKVQTVSIQNKPGVESNSAPITKSATTQVLSRPPRDGRKNVTPANVSSSQGQVQKQAHKEGSQPKKSIVESFIASFSHSDSNHKNCSQHRGNTPTSATIPPARSSIHNRQRGSGESPTVNQPVGQDHPRPLRRNGQAPTQSVRHPAPQHPAVSIQNGGSQPTRRGATVGCSHSHTPVINSRDERAEAVPEAKALSDIDIKKYFGYLDYLLGKRSSKTSSDPAKLILIGKASGEMMALNTTERAYHIDVVLDLRATDERLAHIRRCMNQAKVFREFEGPELDMTKASKTIFRTNRQRADVFDDLAKERKSVHNGEHFKAYVMGPERAFEFELRRMSDKRFRDASCNIAMALLWDNIARGYDPLSFSGCRNLKHLRADDQVSDVSIGEVQSLFKRRHEKDGIVGA